MRARHFLLAASTLCAVLLLGISQAADATAPIVRMVELEIHAEHLPAYKAAVTEEIEDSVRIEPGIIAIYAMNVKDKPSHLRFVEFYASEQAITSHRETPHFKKFLVVTQGMVKARNLVETDNLLLRDKTTFAGNQPVVAK